MERSDIQKAIEIDNGLRFLDKQLDAIECVYLRSSKGTTQKEQVAMSLGSAIAIRTEADSTIVCLDGLDLDAVCELLKSRFEERRKDLLRQLKEI